MTIVRVRGNGLDEYGDPIAGDTRTTLSGVSVAPRSTSDISDRGRAGAVVGLSLFAPYGTDLLHTDQIEMTGEPAADGLYDVDGEIGQWKNPLTGRNAGSEVALKRATG